MARTPKNFKPPPGFVRFETTDGKMRLDARLGPDGPQITGGGYGGWQLVQRPQRAALTEWQGNEPYRQEVPLWLDGWADDASVEKDVTQLERMASADWGDGFKPPVLRCWGIRHENMLWVIETLTWGASLASATTRHRVRQEASVTLLQYVAADMVKITPVQRARRRQATATGDPVNAVRSVPAPEAVEYSQYTVVTIDLTRGMRGISSFLYGTPNRWQEIMRLNNRRSPTDLRFGEKLRVRASWSL